VTALHRLVAAQLSKATLPSGDVDHTLLCELMSTCYEEMERDRKRVDRANKLMQEELAGLTGDLERLVDQFRVQNLNFQAALDTMSQGLCLLDAEGRLIVANRRFLQIYGLSVDIGAPGARWRQSWTECRPTLPARLPGVDLGAPKSIVDQKLNDARIIRIAHETSRTRRLCGHLRGHHRA